MADSTLRMLQALSKGPADETLRLHDLLDRFRRSAFGMLLLIAVLPAFIPLPIGAGGLSGPLVMLVGVQMLLGLRHPWLPAYLCRRGPSRAALGRFVNRSRRAFERLERLVRPRLDILIAHPLASIFSGLQLLLLGFLLSLPLPFTNWAFGAILLLYAIALIERDGVLLAAAWGIGLSTIGSFVLVSDAAAQWVGRLLA